MEATTRTGKKIKGIIAEILVRKGRAIPIELPVQLTEEELAAIKAEKKRIAKMKKEAKKVKNNGTY